jgi:lysophospholipase L1-like esterase
MKLTGKFIAAVLLFLVFYFPGTAQETPRYYQQIQDFKQQDSENPPPKDAILFIGSSSFTRWTDVQAYFPGHVIINRGFGGSTLPDVIRYTPDIIIPYQPRQVVIYCGENDFVSPGVTAEIVFDRFTTLFELIRKDLPESHILFVSFKPSPSRLKYMPEMARGNDMIKKYLKGFKRTGFVDVYHKMLLADGSPMPDIFAADALHMTKAGYDIWQKALKPHLKK